MNVFISYQQLANDTEWQMTYVLGGGGVDLHSDGVEQQSDDVLVAGVGSEVERSHAGLVPQLADQAGARGWVRLDRGRDTGQQLSHRV